MKRRIASLKGLFKHFKNLVSRQAERKKKKLKLFVRTRDSDVMRSREANHYTAIVSNGCKVVSDCDRFCIIVQNMTQYLCRIANNYSIGAKPLVRNAEIFTAILSMCFFILAGGERHVSEFDRMSSVCMCEFRRRHRCRMQCTGVFTVQSSRIERETHVSLLILITLDFRYFLCISRCNTYISCISHI